MSKELDARLKVLEGRPAIDKKFLALQKDIKAAQQTVGQLIQDCDRSLIELRRAQEKLDNQLAEFQKLLENRHIQRLINSGAF